MGGFDLKKSGASGVWLHEGNRVFDEEVALQKRFVFPAKRMFDETDQFSENTFSFCF